VQKAGARSGIRVAHTSANGDQSEREAFEHDVAEARKELPPDSAQARVQAAIETELRRCQGAVGYKGNDMRQANALAQQSSDSLNALQTQLKRRRSPHNLRKKNLVRASFYANRHIGPKRLLVGRRPFHLWQGRRCGKIFRQRATFHIGRCLRWDSNGNGKNARGSSVASIRGTELLLFTPSICRTSSINARRSQAFQAWGSPTGE